jgi:hypothetical protein
MITTPRPTRQVVHRPTYEVVRRHRPRPAHRWRLPQRRRSSQPWRRRRRSRGPRPARPQPAHLPPSLRRSRRLPAHLPPSLRRDRQPPAHPSLPRLHPRLSRRCAAPQPTPTATTSADAEATCSTRLQTSAPTSTASPISGTGRGTWRNAKTVRTACRAGDPVRAPITAVTFVSFTVDRECTARRTCSDARRRRGHNGRHVDGLRHSVGNLSAVQDPQADAPGKLTAPATVDGYVSRRRAVLRLAPIAADLGPARCGSRGGDRGATP